MSASPVKNWYDCENFYEDEKSYNNAESISDSLAKVIREYDDAPKPPIPNQQSSIGVNLRKWVASSIYDFWKKPDETGINALRTLLNEGLSTFGFLEQEDKGLSAIEEIIKATPPITNDTPTQKAFNYLAERVQYIRQQQRRTPDQLTAPIKVLLIGDGWVRRADENNPTIRRINSIPDFAERASFTSALQLQNRGYMPNQVYTIDHTYGQLPDYTGDVQDIPSGTLPDSHFDIIYFEGMYFGRDEKASAQASQAFKAVLPSLKETGLILYHQQEEPFTDLVMEAKSGEITQEKLDTIPDCVKKSVRRQFDDLPLMKVIAPGAKQIILPLKLIIASQESGQEESHPPKPRHGP